MTITLNNFLDEKMFIRYVEAWTFCCIEKSINSFEFDFYKFNTMSKHEFEYVMHLFDFEFIICNL